MGIEPLSSTPFNFSGFQEEKFVLQGKQGFSAVMELDRGDNNLFKDQNQQHQQHKHDHDDEDIKVGDMILQDVINFDPDYDSLQPIELKNIIHQAPSSLTIASLELLRNYGSKFKKLTGENISDNFSSDNIESSSNCSENQRLSTEEIMRIAGARYVHYSAHWNDDFCIPMHPYGLDLGNFSEEENRDVELAQFLLAAAERVGCRQFERASRLLLHCQWNSDVSANAAHRVIFHFAEALRERICKETGKVIEIVMSNSQNQNQNEETEMIQKMGVNESLKCHQKLPFNQVMQFTGIQAMVENLACETKIHFIDLQIRSGVQCTALMQAMAERKECCVESFKVTAIGTCAEKNKIEGTGQRLTSFAESLNLPFSYKAIIVTDLEEIKLDDFDVDEDEAVAVYSAYFVRTLVSRPNCLENLMLVIRNIKPSIMIVLEIDSNHNSPSFVNRFIDALFFFSAFMDCLETCLKEDRECRMAVEAVCAAGIRNIVAAEGKERTVRNVKLDVWRRFFARYKMVETGFSESSLYQANLVAKEFSFGKFCSVDKNGKSLIISWKGTPMHSLSAWKFL